MNSAEIASYLKAHPEFFEQYADMIADITIPHPHGGRTIPISERQILSLREKGKQLESKLREVIQFGEENDVVGQKIHALSLALLRARDAGAVVQAALKHLREDFAVPQALLRVWRGAAGDAPEFQPVSEATREFAAKLIEPGCSAEPAADTAALFGDGAPRQGSYAYVPLRDGDTFGLLALASEEPKRYYAGMGTLYLSRLGELIGCALAAHLPPAD
jgi:uncharacterized protein